MDDIVTSHDGDIADGISLLGPSSRLALKDACSCRPSIDPTLPAGVPTAKADNQILAVVIDLESLRRAR